MARTTFSSSQLLLKSGAPFWRLDYLVRSGKVKAIRRGRGRERRFSNREFKKAKKLLAEPNELQHAR